MSAVADADGWVVETAGEMPPPAAPSAAPPEIQAIAPESAPVATESDTQRAAEEAQARARDEKGRFAAKQADQPAEPVEEARAEPEAPKPPSKRSPEGRKLTLQQEIDSLVRQREQIRRDIEAAAQTKPQARPTPQAPDGGFPSFDAWTAANPDVTDQWDGYYTAKAEYVAERRVQAELQKVAKQNAAALLQTRGKQVYTDWDDTFSKVGDIKISPQLEQVLLTDPDGHRLAYELAKHPDQHSDVLDATDGFALGVALGTLKARIGSAPLAPPQPQIPPAPRPIQPVGSSHASLRTVSLDEKPFEQWTAADLEAHRLAERKAGRR
jgi:hypothetical protein